MATGTSNGLYQFDLSGKNVGYDDQRYDLRASKAGEHYFNFLWDETPHNYGTGHTIFDGVGTTALTVPLALRNLARSRLRRGHALLHTIRLTAAQRH